MSPKRTFNQVPAKTALVLTGSAIALAGYLGASSSDSGHDDRAARPTGLAAALTASPQAQAAGLMNAGPANAGPANAGPANAGLMNAGPANAGPANAGPANAGPANAGAMNAGAYGLGTGLESASTRSPGTRGTTGSPASPGPIALAAYGTAEKHPHLRHQHPGHHPVRDPGHHKRHHAVHHHHARKHRARRHRGRLHGNPWQIAGSLMPAYHWTSWQFHYLNLLWMRESGWNRFAYNHSSGAYGIPQAVPGDKMASAGPNWRTSARTQIIWGMGYIRSRYGDPWNAWQHELRYGWY